MVTYFANFLKKNATLNTLTCRVWPLYIQSIVLDTNIQCRADRDHFQSWRNPSGICHKPNQVRYPKKEKMKTV